MNLGSGQKEEHDILVAGTRIFSPAVQSLLIQFFSLCICFVATTLISAIIQIKPSVSSIIIAQSVTASFLSYLRKLDWWWCCIHFLFPLAVLGCLSLNIPSYYYLVGFISLALLFWSTFQTQVPYYPSKASLTFVLLEFLSDRHAIKFVDVGSGFGGLVLKLSRSRRDCFFSGVEVAPLPWITSYLRARFSSTAVQFLFRDYEKIDLSEFNVVFAYLSPAAMPSLWDQVQKEMLPGSLFLSYEFVVPNVVPDMCINKNPNDPTLYVWRI